MTEREKSRQRKSERQEEINDSFDSSDIPGHNLSTAEWSVVQVDIRIQGRNRNLEHETSLLFDMTLETWL